MTNCAEPGNASLNSVRQSRKAGMLTRQGLSYTMWLLSGVIVCAALSLNALADSCLWYPDKDTINQVQTSSNQVTRVIPLKDPQRLIMNATDCGVWALDKKERKLLRYGADGTLEREINVRSIDPKVNEAEQLHIDSYDDSLWVTDKQRIIHLTATGQVIAKFSAPGPVQRIQVALDRSLWVLGKRDLWRYDSKGMLLASYPLSGHFSGDGLYFEIDSLAGVIWLADNKTLAQLKLVNPVTSPLRIALNRNPSGMTLDPLTGKLWIAQQEALLAYSRAGTLVHSVDLEAKNLRKPEKLAFDPVSRSLWAGTQRAVSRFTDAGEFVGQFVAKDGDEALGAPAFKVEPTITLARPSPSALSNSAQPLFTLVYGAACNNTACSFPGEYFANYQLAATLNNLAVGSQFQFDANSGQSNFTPTSRLPEGAHTFSAQVKNGFDIPSNTVTTTFTVDTLPPRFVTVTPLDGTVVPTPQTTLQGTIDDPTATVALDGASAAQTGATFSFPVTLQPGQNLFSLSAIDPASNRTTVTHTLVRASLSINITSPLAGASVSGLNVLVAGTMDGGANAGVTVNGVVANIVGNQFYANVLLLAGANDLLVKATSLDGASVQKTVSVTSAGPSVVEVTADSGNGVAPFKVTFTVNSAAIVQSIQADFNGDGTTDFVTTSLAAPISFTYGQPGVYNAQFVVSTLTNGFRNDYTATVPVIVVDAVALDVQLKALWQGFAGALVARDKAKAMQYLNAQARDKYGPVFDALLSGMPQILASFSNLQTVTINSDVGEYAINRIVDGVNRIFFIYLIRDIDGVWRIDSM